MKIPVFVFFCMLLMLYPSMVTAGNVVRQTLDAQNTVSPRVICQNPRFNFSPKETEICINAYQGCMRQDLRQAERELCLVETVKKGKMATVDQAAQDSGQKSGGPAVSRGSNLDFSFTPFQAYDLIEMCEQKLNKNRQICSGAILPHKAKIMSDIKDSRR